MFVFKTHLFIGSGSPAFQNEDGIVGITGIKAAEGT
jgi:hypothetical protein